MICKQIVEKKHVFMRFKMRCFRNKYFVKKMSAKFEIIIFILNKDFLLRKYFLELKVFLC
jgi:hypothetical protein